MSDFKRQLAKDLRDVFHNADEFGETHNINGESVTCSVQNETHNPQGDKYDPYTKVNKAVKTIYVPESSLSCVPVVNAILKLDNAEYTVKSVLHECGELVIRIEAYR